MDRVSSFYGFHSAGGYCEVLFVVQLLEWITVIFPLLSRSLKRSSRGKGAASFTMHHGGHDIPNLSTLFGWFLFLVYVYAMSLHSQVIGILNVWAIRAVDKSCPEMLRDMCTNSCYVNSCVQAKVSPRHRAIKLVMLFVSNCFVSMNFGTPHTSLNVAEQPQELTIHALPDGDWIFWQTSIPGEGSTLYRLEK